MPGMRTRVAPARAVSMGGGAGTMVLARIIFRATMGTPGTNEWRIDNTWPWISMPVGLGPGSGFLVFFAVPAREQRADLAPVDEPGQGQANRPLVQPLFTALEEATLTARHRPVARWRSPPACRLPRTREKARSEREQDPVSH